MSRRLRVAITARSVFPLHGLGGLERSVYDLARHLAREGTAVTLITRSPQNAGLGLPTVAHTAKVGARRSGVEAEETGPGAALAHRSAKREGGDLGEDVSLVFVPYRTFPFAGRRGTTVIDRSTAYPRFGMKAGQVAAELVSRGEIDVVHGFGASVLGYARKRSRLKAPLVLNPQGLEEFGATDPSRARLKRIGYLPLRRAVRACADAADAVIATDRSLEPAVRRHLEVPDERIVTIPNALDLEILDALATPQDGARVRRDAGIAADEVVLLSVGRLERNKGFHVLAHALAALRDHSGRLARERWRWVIVGDGPLRGKLQALIAELGLTANVLFAGKLPDPVLHAWYESAELFVHPTLYEGSSLVTLEAMAHCRACVVTNAGGLADKVKKDVNGWIVPAGDPAALAAAISGALERPERLEQMGKAGRAIVERDFSWPIAVRDTLKLYERLLRTP